MWRPLSLSVVHMASSSRSRRWLCSIQLVATVLSLVMVVAATHATAASAYQESSGGGEAAALVGRHQQEHQQQRWLADSEPRVHFAGSFNGWTLAAGIRCDAGTPSTVSGAASTWQFLVPRHQLPTAATTLSFNAAPAADWTKTSWPNHNVSLTAAAVEALHSGNGQLTLLATLQPASGPGAITNAVLRVLVGPGAAPPCPMTGQVYFAGSFNGWSMDRAYLCGPGVSLPGQQDTVASFAESTTSMWYLPLYHLSPNAIVEFKAAINASWNVNYGTGGTVDGANEASYRADASGRLTLLLNASTVATGPGFVAPRLFAATPEQRDACLPSVAGEHQVYFTGTFNDWRFDMPATQCAYPERADGAAVVAADGTPATQPQVQAFYLPLSGLTPDAEYQVKATLGPTWALPFGDRGIVNGAPLYFRANGAGRALVTFVPPLASGAPAALAASYVLKCDTGGLGLVSFYVYACIASAVYLIATALVALQSVRHSRFGDKSSARLRSLCMALVLAYCMARAIMTLLHVTRLYTRSPNVIKHVLFVLPLCFVCSAYSLTIYFWYRAAAMVRGRAPTAIVRTFQAVNILVFLLLTASMVLHGLLDGTADVFALIGATNVGLAVLFVCGIVVFLAFGLALRRELAAARRFHNAKGSRGSATGSEARAATRACCTCTALAKVTWLTACCSLCFAASAVQLALEGEFLLRTNTFPAWPANGEYTTPLHWEITLALTTALPPLTLVAVLWRGPTGASWLAQIAARAARQVTTGAGAALRRSRKHTSSVDSTEVSTSSQPPTSTGSEAEAEDVKLELVQTNPLHGGAATS